MPEAFQFRTPPLLQDQDLTLVLIEQRAANPEKGYAPSYVFEMQHTETKEPMGKIDLRIAPEPNELIYYGGHIGYTVFEAFRGKKYAARSVRLLLPFAKAHGITELCITCNPDNIASRKTCEAAGGTLHEIVDLPEHNEQYTRGDRQKCRYLFSL